MSISLSRHCTRYSEVTDLSPLWIVIICNFISGTVYKRTLTRSCLANHSKQKRKKKIKSVWTDCASKIEEIKTTFQPFLSSYKQQAKNTVVLSRPYVVENFVRVCLSIFLTLN